MRKMYAIIVVLLCIAGNGSAQEFFFSDSPDTIVKQRRSEVATQIAVGVGNVLDTYLSPEKYNGAEGRFVSQVLRDSRKRKMTYLLTHEAALGCANNRSATASCYTGHYSFCYAAMYRWALMNDRVMLRAGLMGEVNVGFAYNTRNSANNPAQGYASLGIGPQIMAQYRFTLWRKPMRVTYETRMPWLGMMFSPNYGQSYYELFVRGNYDNNVVFTSLATFQMRQQLSLDVMLAKRLALRVAYLNDIRQAQPNGLKQHHWYNAGVVGVVLHK